MDDKLILALVAAGSAVGGVLVTQVFTIIREQLNARSKSRALMREKYEELAESINESIIYRVKVTTLVSDEEFLSSLTNVPLNRARTLSLLYFQELIEPAKKYSEAYIEYCFMLGESLMVDDVLSVGMRAAKEQGEKLDSVLDKLESAQIELYECLTKNAPKYVKA